VIETACELAVARLEWEFELQEKGYQAQAFMERGLDPPAWYQNEPIQDDATRLVLEAFRSASTERQVGMALGPIPESAVHAFGDRMGLDEATMAVLRPAVRACDDAYLRWAEKRRKRAQGRSGESK
jgi:hypothetical protein